MATEIYIIRTAEYPTVEEALEDGAAYKFQLNGEPDSRQTDDLIDCIHTTSRCIDSDMNEVKGFIRINNKYVELGDYYDQIAS